MTARPPIPPPPLKGGCLWAARYRLTVRPLAINACHCTDCKRLSGVDAAVLLHLPRGRWCWTRARRRVSARPPTAAARSTSCAARPAARGCGETAERCDAHLRRRRTLDDAAWAIPTSHIWAGAATAPCRRPPTRWSSKARPPTARRCGTASPASIPRRPEGRPSCGGRLDPRDNDADEAPRALHQPAQTCCRRCRRAPAPDRPDGCRPERRPRPAPLWQPGDRLHQTRTGMRHQRRAVAAERSERAGAMSFLVLRWSIESSSQSRIASKQRMAREQSGRRRQADRHRADRRPR